VSHWQDHVARYPNRQREAAQTRPSPGSNPG